MSKYKNMTGMSLNYQGKGRDPVKKRSRWRNL
nr:MAG TPA: hypothetical protein [Caudoviricetes sp.]DAH47372.1 MAG TPA: hypothetical protein [Caudoviricetes sp.]